MKRRLHGESGGHRSRGSERLQRQVLQHTLCPSGRVSGRSRVALVTVRVTATMYANVLLVSGTREVPLAQAPLLLCEVPGLGAPLLALWPPPFVYQPAGSVLWEQRRCSVPGRAGSRPRPPPFRKHHSLLLGRPLGSERPSPTVPGRGEAELLGRHPLFLTLWLPFLSPTRPLKLHVSRRRPLLSPLSGQDLEALVSIATPGHLIKGGGLHLF